MKSTTSLITLALLISGPALLQADTVKLNDGTVLTGKVLSETPESIVFEAQISAAIKDEKVLARTEIANLEKDGPDIAAYRALANVKPDPLNSLPAAMYERSAAALNAFLQQYPASAYAKEIEANLKALTEEQTKVAEGQVKINGEWISKEEATKRKAHITGLSQFYQMRTLAARGDLVGALNSFDFLEKASAQTSAYADAIELAAQVLNALGQKVEYSLEGLVKIKSDLKTTLDMATITRRAELQVALAHETEGFEAAMKASQNLKWPPLIPRYEPSLTQLKQLITQEKSRLAGLPLAKMRAAEQLVVNAQKYVLAKDFAAAEELLKQAESAWQQFEGAAYVKTLMAEAKIAEAAKQAEAKAAAEAAQAAQVAQAAEAAKAAKPTAAPAENKSVMQQQVAAVAPEEKSFFLTIPGALTVAGVLIVIAGGVALVSRMRQNKQAAEL